MELFRIVLLSVISGFSAFLSMRSITVYLNKWSKEC